MSLTRWREDKGRCPWCGGKLGHWIKFTITNMMKRYCRDQKCTYMESKAFEKK